MVKVNMEGVLEMECPNYNKYFMESLELTKSPELKVSIFLGENPAQESYNGNKNQEECTQISCGLKRIDGKCYEKSNCLYNSITL
jgi:hypothetical protein